MWAPGGVAWGYIGAEGSLEEDRVADGNGVVSKGSRLRLRVAADERLLARVRTGDRQAFEALYNRHSSQLLSFCAYLLGSRHDAEDAVQCTFAAAYRSLLRNARPVALRPWLFTIARNESLSILRKRRPLAELNGEPAPNGDPHHELEVREELRHTLKGLLELPEGQRTALVLAELHGMSQVEIAAVLGVRAEQVKAYVYQARSHLISDKDAREADCHEIREELSAARGAALLRGRLRRHVRSCDRCRTYAKRVAQQRRQLSCLLPLTPSLMLKYRALEQAIAAHSADPATRAGGTAIGGTLAGAALELASGGMKGAAVKVATGVACLGATACVGATMLGGSGAPAGKHAPLATPSGHSASPYVASTQPSARVSSPQRSGLHARRRQPGAGAQGAAPEPELPPPSAAQHSQPPRGSANSDAGADDQGAAGLEDSATTAPLAAAHGEQQSNGSGHGRNSSGTEAKDEGRQHRNTGESTGASATPKNRQQEREQRQQEREERQQEREERQQEREERQPGGAAGSPGGKGRRKHHREAEEPRPQPEAAR